MASGRHEEPVAAALDLLPALGLGRDHALAAVVRDGRHREAQLQVVFLTVGLGEALSDVRVLPVEEHVAVADDSHVAPHLAEEVAQLDGDVAPADHHQPVGDAVETERLVAREKGRLVGPRYRLGNHRPGAAGEDDSVGREPVAVGTLSVDRHRPGADEAALGPVYGGPVALACPTGLRFGLLGDGRGHVVHDVRERDAVDRGVDTELGGVADRLDDVRTTDELLRGVTAAVQTGAAQPPALDEGRLQPRVGRRGGDQVAGPAAEHGDVVIWHRIN